MHENIAVERDGSILRVTLKRPERHNALNGQMVEELTQCLLSEPHQPGVRALVLRGEGRSFCSGADIVWMREIANFDAGENLREAENLWDMLSALDNCPVPTVAQVHGSAFGGGLGLVACCDIAVASESAVFGFTEVRLGILPAVISPFVIAKIGETHARALFPTAHRFPAIHALRIGLVHDVVPESELENAVREQANLLLQSAPVAASEARQLIKKARSLAHDELRTYATRTLARLRASDEGREGLSAFLEHRAPSWQREK